LIKVKYGEYWLAMLFVISAMIGMQLPPGSEATFSVGEGGAEGADGASGGNENANNGRDGVGIDGTSGNANGADGVNGEDGNVRSSIVNRIP
jgi:hypothetical protein